MVTAGLKCTPEMWPKLAANTIRARPNDKAPAITPPPEQTPHMPMRTNSVVPIYRAKRSIDVPVFANGEPYEFHQQWSNDLNEFILVFGHDVDIDIPKQTIAT